MLKLLRKMWAERAALEIMNLAWRISDRYRYWNDNDSMSQFASKLDECALAVAKTHGKVRDIMLQGDTLPTDQAALKELKTFHARLVSEIDKKLKD